MNIVRNIVTSSNWDLGRGGHQVTGIVLHTMVGTWQGAQARFSDPSQLVSVHYGVDLGGTIHQWVDEANTAWQAGNYPVNQTTIGIEHEDNGNANDSVRTDALYEASAELVADICRRYGFPADTNHVFLHKDVIDKNRYPGGTACPDGLDTNRIISMAAAKLNQGDDMIDSKEKATDLLTLGLHDTTGDFTDSAINSIINQPYPVVVKAMVNDPKWRTQNDWLVAFPKLQSTVTQLQSQLAKTPQGQSVTLDSEIASQLSELLNLVSQRK